MVSVSFSFQFLGKRVENKEAVEEIRGDIWDVKQTFKTFEMRQKQFETE